MLNASMILGQRFDEKNIEFGGLDGSSMEVDEEIVCRGSRWLFHLSGSTVNCRSFHRQLTAAGI